MLRASYTQAGPLLGPGIRRILFRYGSMRAVFIEEVPEGLWVTYQLITDETRTIIIPARLILDDKYEEIEERLTHYLGRLP